MSELVIGLIVGLPALAGAGLTTFLANRLEWRKHITDIEAFKEDLVEFKVDFKEDLSEIKRDIDTLISAESKTRERVAKVEGHLGLNGAQK